MEIKSRGLKFMALCGAAVALSTTAMSQGAGPQGADRPSVTRPGSSGEQPNARGAQDEEKAVPRNDNAKPSAQSPANSPARAQGGRNEGRDGQANDGQREPARNQRAQEPERAPGKQKQDASEQKLPNRDRPNAAQAPGASERQPKQSSSQPANDRQVVQPNDQQRTRISASIKQANVQPLRNVNFSVSVGTVVPTSVRFYPVTSAIVEVYPQYRGYSFIVVEDEIVIIEPRTKKIVTIIHEGRASSASVSRSKVTLTDLQRDVIRRNVQQRTTGSGGRAVLEREVGVGEDLPDAIEFESFPDTIYTEVPEIRGYRYIVRDRDIYLVEPDARRVIEIIR
jgi:hypothetical protein